MTLASPYELARRAVAAVLAVALVVASLVPASAAAPPRTVVIGGVAISICADGTAPDQGAPHHDCGLCCLRHVSAVPPAPAVSLPVRLTTTLEMALPPSGQTPPAQRRGAHSPRAPPIA